MIKTQNIIQRCLLQKDEVSINEIIDLGCRVKKSEHSIRASVNRLVKEGTLTKKKKNGTLFYKLSKEGERRIQIAVDKHLHIDSLIDGKFPEEKWEGIWTVVVFGIPETLRKKRNSLRNELITLGFGMLFGSTWISPYNKSAEVGKLITSLGLKKYVAVFQCQTVQLECCIDVKEIIYRVWNLKKLEKLYKTFAKQWENLARFLEKKIKQKEKLEARKLFPKVLQLQLDLMDIYLEEPALPRELLPKNWIGLHCHDLVHYVFGLLNKMEFSDEYAYLVQVHEIRGLMLPPSKLCAEIVKK